MQKYCAVLLCHVCRLKNKNIHNCFMFLDLFFLPHLLSNSSSDPFLAGLLSHCRACAQQNQGGAKLECFRRGKGVEQPEVNPNYSQSRLFHRCNISPVESSRFFSLISPFPAQKHRRNRSEKFLEKYFFHHIKRLFPKDVDSNNRLLLLRYFWTAEVSGHLRQISLPHWDWMCFALRHQPSVIYFVNGNVSAVPQMRTDFRK